MRRQELEELLREVIREQLSEMNTTGAVGGYSTPFAFSKDTKNRAVKFLQKIGWTSAERPKRPSSTKTADYR